MFISASGFSGGAATTPSILRFLQPQQQQGQQQQGMAEGGDLLQDGDWDTEEHEEEGEEEGDALAAAPAGSRAPALGVEAGAQALPAAAAAVVAAPPVRYQRLSREEIDEEVLAELPEEMRRVRGGEG